MEYLYVDQLELSKDRQSRQPIKPTPAEIQKAKQFGLLAPVVVKATPVIHAGYSSFEILQNERSWYIALAAEIEKVPVTKISVTDAEARLLIESEPDNPIDEAILIERILNVYPQPIAQLAKKFGRKRADLSNQLRLLKLDESVQTLVKTKKLTVGQVRPLVTLPPKTQREIANIAVLQKLSAREIERKASSIKKNKKERDQVKVPRTKSSDIRDLENRISEVTGCPCEITDTKLEINYFGNQEILTGILEKIGIQADNEDIEEEYTPTFHI